MTDKVKYSLLIEPKGEVGVRLQALIDKLAAAYGTPSFVPHVTLIGHIEADAEAIEQVKQKVDRLANTINRFAITLTEYGFMDEEYRCLYLLAESPRLDLVYAGTLKFFPQVGQEHFRAMPHLSVLYGHFTPAVKQQIITANPLEPLTFEAQSLDLYETNGPADSWRLCHSMKLGNSQL